MTPPYNGMKPIHPGEILRDWLDELDMSAENLSEAIHISAECVISILDGKRDITSDTALRLSRYFSTTPQYWLNLQRSYSLKHAEANTGLAILDLVVPRNALNLQQLAEKCLKSNAKLAQTPRTLMNVLANNVAVCEQVLAARALLIDQSYKEHIKVPRTLASVLHEMRAAIEFDSFFEGHFNDVEKCLLIYEKPFKIPTPNELASILSRLETTESHSVRSTDSFVQTSESMETCWLHQQNPEESVRGLHNLHRLGELVACNSYKDQQVTCQIRDILGDWRDTIRWPLPMWTDMAFRSDQYELRDFCPNLTDMPSSAFHEAVERVGLLQEYPVRLEQYENVSVLPSILSPHVALPRTIHAFELIRTLETHLREFIERTMSLSFDSNWAKIKIPTAMYDKWQSRKEKATTASDATRALVAYADFNDYLDIFCSPDNWRQVFRSFFYRQEDIRESLQRLYPIYQDTQNKRPVTHDDELLLLVESTRLLRQIRGER